MTSVSVNEAHRTITVITIKDLATDDAIRVKTERTITSWYDVVGAPLKTFRPYGARYARTFRPVEMRIELRDFYARVSLSGPNIKKDGSEGQQMTQWDVYGSDCLDVPWIRSAVERLGLAEDFPIPF